MTHPARAGMIIVCACALAGCGYREVKAPCSPDEGQPTILTSYAALARQGTPFDGLAVGEPALDPCGPMRPIREEPR